MVATNFFTRAAVLLAAARQVSAGSAIVHNQCPYQVYLWSISNTNSAMQTLAANGGEYSEAYEINPDGGGISIKIGKDTKGLNITQFEYTYTPSSSSLWYDLSNINGFPFEDYGVTVVPTDSSCRQVSCPAGQTLCAQAYNVPTDNFATAECSSDADAVIVLCSGETDTSGSASVTSVASEAASTASVVTVFSSTAAATSTAVVESSSAVTSSSTSTKKPGHHTHAASTSAQSTATSAAPATTEAPATSEAAANPYVVVQTTFVTHVVTVEGRSPQPTAAKRDVHHEHAAVHAEHAARRHSHPRAFPKK